MPRLAALTSLLARAVEALSETLAAGTQPANLPPTLRQLLLLGEPFGERIVDALAALVARIAAGRPAGRPLRILEIGAGTGLIARRLLQRLRHLGLAVSYMATDPTEEAATQLAAVLAPFQNARVERWDPAQGKPAAGMADLVIGVQALTFGAFDEAGLPEVAARLAPGGTLAVIEPAPSRALDFLFGRSPAGGAPASPPAFPFPPRAAARNGAPRSPPPVLSRARRRRSAAIPGR